MSYIAAIEGMKCRKALVLLISGIFVVNFNSYCQIRRVWAVDDGEKIKKEDLTNPLAEDSQNNVWKDKSVNLFGARNEIVAFQLIIQAGDVAAENVNVSVSDLKNDRSVIHGSESGSADPFDFRGRYIELFTEHYLNIVKRSPPAWFFAATASPSAYYTGWVPDCLIPFSAPEGKGGAPFSIEANSNQGVWIDIFIPEDAVPGTYKGKAVITVAGKAAFRIPVFLKVYGFTLSDSTHISSMFFFRSAAGRHGIGSNDPAYYDLEGKYFQMAHRHRLDLVRGVRNLNEMTDHYKRYLTGELYTSENGYAGPGEKIGNTTYSVTGFPVEFGGNLRNMNESNWRAGSDAWENWFIQNSPHVQRNRYLYPDEPRGAGAIDTIRLQGKWTHDNPGTGKSLKALVTTNINPSLEGYIDFWSVSSQGATLRTKPQDVYSEQAKGVKFGIYNGYRPGMGAVVTDADAVDFRVMPWIVWKYNIDQYFYWQTTFWGKINVFKNPLTYEDRINGDGTFFYPGRDILFPSESRNLDGPLSSIRMKNWRRGVQDYEYLWIAKKAGLGSQVQRIVDECVPSALWEADSKKDASWSSRGYKFDEYRRKLADLISGINPAKK